MLRFLMPMTLGPNLADEERSPKFTDPEAKGIYWFRWCTRRYPPAQEGPIGSSLEDIRWWPASFFAGWVFSPASLFQRTFDWLVTMIVL